MRILFWKREILPFSLKGQFVFYKFNIHQGIGMSMSNKFQGREWKLIIYTFSFGKRLEMKLASKHLKNALTWSAYYAYMFPHEKLSQNMNITKLLRCFHVMKIFGPLKNSMDWLIKKNDIMFSPTRKPWDYFLCFSLFLVVWSNYILWWLVASISTMAVFAIVANLWKNVAIAKINCFFQPQ